MKRILPLLIPFLLLSFTGCDQEDPNSCDYWVKRLANPSKAREALQQVGMMKCDKAGDALKTMFDEGRNRTEILAAAVSRRDFLMVLGVGGLGLGVGIVFWPFIKDPWMHGWGVGSM